MKNFALTFLLSLFFSNSVWAESLNCTVSEFTKGQTLDQVVELNLASTEPTPDPSTPVDDDPHSRMQFFNLNKFTQYEGFVAVVKEMAVINLQTHDGSYGYSSTGNVYKGEFVSLQVLFPSEDENPTGVLIQCSLKK